MLYLRRDPIKELKQEQGIVSSYILAQGNRLLSLGKLINRTGDYQIILYNSEEDIDYTSEELKTMEINSLRQIGFNVSMNLIQRIRKEAQTHVIRIHPKITQNMDRKSIIISFNYFISQQYIDCYEFCKKVNSNFFTQ